MTSLILQDFGSEGKRDLQRSHQRHAQNTSLEKLNSDTTRLKSRLSKPKAQVLFQNCIASMQELHDQK
jgi:hypothetical protein